MELLDRLRDAAQQGDRQAITFLQMFEPWAVALLAAIRR